MQLQAGAVYLIELCSGEQCRWRFLGEDAAQRCWWRDLDSGREFDAAGLMYAWQVVAALPDDGDGTTR